MNTKKESHVDDYNLLAEFVSGDNHCFDVLIDKYRARVLGSILHIVHDMDTAEDLLQETLIKVISLIKRGKYNDEGKFLPWILRVARNTAIDHFRKQKRRNKTVIDLPVEIMENTVKEPLVIEECIIQCENKVAVRFLVDRLPPKQREVLILRYYEDMSFRQISNETKVSINTALGRMRYALINLKKFAKEHNLQY